MLAPAVDEHPPREKACQVGNPQLIQNFERYLLEAVALALEDTAAFADAVSFASISALFASAFAWVAFISGLEA
jgi:hypothetical protein